MSGHLYGIGVGPGDPDLMTLRGRDILARVPVIAYLAPEEGDGLARSIAAPHIPEGRTEIVMRTAFVPGGREAVEAYDKGAAEIAAHLDAGRDVAVICEGDPFLYGSFLYLFERLGRAYETEVVPGISSVMAAPAAAGMPLVTRNDSLAVVPATLSEETLATRLGAADAAVVLKVGRHMPKLRRVLARLGMAEGARYVERVGQEGGRVLSLAEAPEKPPYFSLVLAKRGPSAEQDLPEGVVLVALERRGLALARRLADVLPGAEVHGREGRTQGADVVFHGTAGHLRDLFRDGRPIVAVCAAGIVIRALAPLLGDKRDEPPVLAVSADGASAVPLLGGHRGANRLARALAAATRGQAAITTASDVNLGIALDDPPRGWTVANPGAAKDIASALMAGGPVSLRVEAGDAGWIHGSKADFSTDADRAVVVTDRAVAAPGNDLILHPPVLALGVGCERGTPPDDLLSLARETLAENGLAEGAVGCVVSLDVKMDEAAVLALADSLGAPARFFTSDELEAETPRLAHPSDVVFAEVGCHGVAEGAALAAAGAKGALIVEKTKGPRATCAVARADGNLDPSRIGRKRGRLAIVGVGPGTPEWRTPAAARAIREASDVVGYRLYLDLVADLTEGKRLHDSALAQEEARCRMALDIAAEGRDVALVCSGDAGIYALATLVMELLDREDRSDWNRLEIVTHPGVSAFQAAAARIGAPMGHDFCLISLSDLLTPADEIRRRLRAASEGDFVVAFYNPVSKRRRTLLTEARDILLENRGPDTPVVLARNLGREGERIDVIGLGDLTPEHADMLTLVVVGNSQTRRMERGGATRVYTPRGYAAKMVPNKPEGAKS